MKDKYPPNIIELSPHQLEENNQPILFNEIETPEIPAGLLTGVFSEFASTLATATETPEALSVMTILGVISACVAKRFCVSPKDGWREPINIYTLIALPPANNKSLVLSNCLKPLIEWEAGQVAVLGNEIKRQRSERKSQEKLIESLRIKMAREKDISSQRKLINEIAEMEVALIEPIALPQLFANDATPESLAASTYEQGGRFAIFSDEGGIMETLAGLYNSGASNIDILLKGIDGGEMRIRRRDRSINLNPFLTLVLAVQPAVIQTLGDKRAYLGNGALERFLYVLPKSKLGYRTHDKPSVSAAIQHAYHTKIKALLNLAPLIENGREQSQLLTLSPQASEEWRAFQRHIETQLRADGKLSGCLGWGGKICGFALRLAGLLHVATEKEGNLMISEECMSKALTIAALLIEHAIAAYSLMGIDQVTEDAKELFRWIITSRNQFFSRTEIMLAMRHKKIGKAERLLKALGVLIDRNIISAQRIPTRKPTMMYYVHPTIFMGV